MEVNVTNLGENLIFLISQPRAGSTLLQRILGSHPEIHTVSEPWLMLHPSYALRNDGHQAEYNEHLARTALQEFVKALPGGEEEYVEGVRRMYTYLYDRALASSGKRYFLDKTPRYYFIIPELYRVFPKASFIILLRNPMAVLCSVLQSWIKADWFRLYKFKHDLVQAPRLLLEGVKFLGERGTIVHYEHLVSNPESEVQRICERLEVDFVPEMIEYGRHGPKRWRFGDQDKVKHYTRPVSRDSEKWMKALINPQIWRLTNDYLQLLGQEIVEQMGCDYEKLGRIVEAHRPHRSRLWSKFPLYLVLKHPNERKRWERGIVRLKDSLRRRGIRRAAIAAVKKLVYLSFKTG